MASDDGVRRAREWLVSGRVQGVAFRAATRREALVLGLDGLAENLPDGRVRVVAVGPAGALDALGAWLRDGPPAARVDGLEAREVPTPDGLAGPTGFATR